MKKSLLLVLFAVIVSGAYSQRSKVKVYTGLRAEVLTIPSSHDVKVTGTGAGIEFTVMYPVHKRITFVSSLSASRYFPYDKKATYRSMEAIYHVPLSTGVRYYVTSAFFAGFGAGLSFTKGGNYEDDKVPDGRVLGSFTRNFFAHLYPEIGVSINKWQLRSFYQFSPKVYEYRGAGFFRYTQPVRFSYAGLSVSYRIQ